MAGLATSQQAACIEQAAGVGGQEEAEAEKLAREELRDLRLTDDADHPEVTMEYLLVY